MAAIILHRYSIVLFIEVQSHLAENGRKRRFSTAALGTGLEVGWSFCDGGHRRLQQIAIVLENTITQLMEFVVIGSESHNDFDGKVFLEFRRKVRDAEVLSGAVEQLLRLLQFTGKVSVIVQNGRVLKSGYEEGYFRQER
jgi:hypothetical protein